MPESHSRCALWDASPGQREGGRAGLETMAWAPGSRSDRGQQPGHDMLSLLTCHPTQVRTSLPSCPGTRGAVRSGGGLALTPFRGLDWTELGEGVTTVPLLASWPS